MQNEEILFHSPMPKGHKDLGYWTVSPAYPGPLRDQYVKIRALFDHIRGVTPYSGSRQFCMGTVANSIPDNADIAECFQIIRDHITPIVCCPVGYHHRDRMLDLYTAVIFVAVIQMFYGGGLSSMRAPVIEDPEESVHPSVVASILLNVLGDPQTTFLMTLRDVFASRNGTGDLEDLEHRLVGIPALCGDLTCHTVLITTIGDLYLERAKEKALQSVGQEVVPMVMAIMGLRSVQWTVLLSDPDVTAYNLSRGHMFPVYLKAVSQKGLTPWKRFTTDHIPAS